MFYVYILESSQNKSYYTGSCGNIQLRLNQHNRGLVRSTQRFIPWNLLYFEEHEDLKSARRRESQIKNWKKRKSIERLIEHFKI